MSDLDWKEVEKIIDEVIDLPSRERYRFIEEKCGHNEQLKTEVLQLVESIYDSQGWLEELKDQKSDFYSDISEDLKELEKHHDFIGQEVGSYTIKEQIGKGGMGSVFLAERTDDSFEHCVAIKILRQNRATKSNIQRFKREQRILAGLNHASIAKLYDGGITSEGFPYIIMEYVSGVPITEYCSKNNISIRKRINLFKQTLEAVRFAHENLVIHRDLKPDNILVDENGNVKILDFGISKLLEDDDDLSLTRTGTRLLTPKYAAPEQIKQENITTATDLYSLGVIFYELLSEHPPFDFKDRTTYEAEQIILTQSADKPSNKAPSKKRAEKLKGDLNGIALKAIRKEPDQRYRVATEFLDDLNNYLNGLPVSARTDTFKYRAAKFVGRHKKSLTISAVILMLIIGLTGFYTWRLTVERNRAQIQSERAEEMTDFLLSLFKSNNPKESIGEDITASEILKNGLQKIDSKNVSSYNKALILGSIGQIQLNMGQLEEAKPNIKRAYKLISDSVQTESVSKADISTLMGNLHHAEGNLDSALVFFQESDSLHKKIGSVSTSEYRVNINNLGNVYTERAEYSKAIQALETINQFPISDNDPQAISNKAYYFNNLAAAYSKLGNQQKAIKNYEASLRLRKKLYESDNPELGLTYHNMGVAYMGMDLNNKAYELFKEAYRIRKQALGPEHMLVASTASGLALTAHDLGRSDEAIRYHRESIRIIKKQAGTTHYRYALALRNYATLLIDLKRFVQAEQILDEATKTMIDAFGKEHGYNGYLDFTKASLYKEWNKPTKANTHYERGEKIFQDNYSSSFLELGKILNSHGIFKYQQNNYEQADDLLIRAQEIFKENDQTNTLYYGKNMHYLGKTYFELKRYDLAQDYLKKAYKVFIDIKGETFNLALDAKKVLTKIPQ